MPTFLPGKSRSNCNRKEIDGNEIIDRKVVDNMEGFLNMSLLATIGVSVVIVVLGVVVSVVITKIRKTNRKEKE